MNARGELGRNGEDLAAEHLLANGYGILARNFRCQLGELDIVAARDRTIVFCEVKTRRTARWGAPAEAVDPRKQARIRRLAAVWLASTGTRAANVSFDVISIVDDGAQRRLEHLVDAF